MRGDTWIFVVAGIYAIGLYFVTGQTVVERYGWMPVLALIGVYITFILSKKIDDLERRLKLLEQARKQERFNQAGQENLYEL